MTPNWQVGVRLTLLTSGFTGLSIIARQFNTVNMGAAQLQKRLNVIRGLAIGGAVTMGFGLAIAGGLFKAANQAGDLALALKSVQIAGHYTNAEMTTLQRTTFQVSNITARSAKDVAGWMRIVATSSNFTAKQLASIMPSVAKFADVMFFTKNVPFEQSITLGTRFSHLFQMYSPAALERGLNMLASASRLVPGGPQQIMTSLAQSAAMGQTLGVPPEQMVALTALLDRLGMSSRGGTGLMNILQYAVPSSVMLTRSRSNKQTEALAALGLLVRGPHGAPMPIGMESGAFNAVEYFQALARSFRRFTQDKNGPALGEARAAWMSLVHNAFNLRGARVADIMGALPASMQQLDIILRKFQNDMTVAEAQSKLLDTWNVQWSRMTTNLQNVFIKIMLPFVQGPGPSALQKIGDFFAQVADKITPTTANAIVKVLAALAAVTIGLGGLLLISAALSAISLVAGPVGIVAGVIAALVLLLVSNSPGIKRLRDTLVPMVEKLASAAIAKIRDFAGSVTYIATILGSIQIDPSIMAFMSLLGAIGRAKTGANNFFAAQFGRLMNVKGMTPDMMNKLLLTFPGLLYQVVTNPNLLKPSTPIAPRSPRSDYQRGRTGLVIEQVHVHTQGTTREQAMQILAHLDELARDHYRASGTGVLHPLIAPTPSMAYG